MYSPASVILASIDTILVSFDAILKWISVNINFRSQFQGNVHFIGFKIPYFRNYYPRVLFNLRTFSNYFYSVKCAKIRVQFEVRVLLKVGL